MAAKRGTPARKRAATNNSKETGRSSQRSVVNEAICIMVIALALIMGISLIGESMGVFGQGVRYVLFGLFGGAAFVLPMFAIVAAITVLLGKTKRVSWVKVAMGAVLFLVLAVLIYVINESGGGFFGRHIGAFLIEVLSRAGAMILVVSLGIILTILVSGKSLFSLLVSVFGWGGRQIKAGKEAMDERRRERELARELEDDTYDEPIINDARKPAGLKPLEPRPEMPTFQKPIEKTAVFDYVINDEQHAEVAEAEVIAPEIMQEQVAPVITESTPEEPAIEDFEYEVKWAQEVVKGIIVKGIGVEGYEHKAVEIDGSEVSTQLPISGGNVNLEFAVSVESAKMQEEYVYPPIELLKENPYVPSLSSRVHIEENSRKLIETLKSFGVEARVVEVCVGPTVTRYELSPGVGVKVSKISGLADDLALSLAAVGIRIEAPVPGKPVVGIEIPNKEAQAVFLREVIDDEAFWAHPSKIAFAIGKDIAGNTVIADIAKMPHLLIAGATGAGKSVGINTLVASIIYKATPEEVKLIMIDPKVVELSVYNGIPHLLIPVVTDPQKASGALSWAVREMDMRYNMFAETMTRDLKGFNETLTSRGEPALPQIVIIIDELADLMMTCGKEVEASICRLAQKARAAGIHLIIATQRPSVDVITGLIKANVPSRLAFAVSSGIDSRTILDGYGAEKLLGKGDMLFSPVGLSKPQRIQGSFISDKEVENLVNFIKRDAEVEYDNEMIEEITSSAARDDNEPAEGDDAFTNDAIEFVISKDKASVSMLQRRFRIGYNRAARLMEELEEKGIVGPEDGSKPRKVLVSHYQWLEMKRGN